MTTFAAKTAEPDSAKSHGANRQSDNLPAVQSAPLFDFPIQRKAACACGGDCPNCGGDLNLKSDEFDIQTKLTIGDVGDQYEQEADNVADLIMRMPKTSGEISDVSRHSSDLTISGLFSPMISRIQRQAIDEEMPEENQATMVVQAKFNEPLSESSAQRVQTKAKEKSTRLSHPISLRQVIQRQADEESKEELEDISLQMSVVSAEKSKSSASPTTGKTIEESLSRKRGGGQILPLSTKEFMEERFGVDFSGVRVHTDSESDNLNRLVHSYAFTTGRDIYFSSGMYQPGTTFGDRLLAHELTHVVQQTGGTRLQRASTSNRFLIQRNGFTGNIAHFNISKELRAVNSSNLITEAPIPGALRDYIAINEVGFADLYESTDNTIAGIRGYYPESDSKNPLAYENMPTKISRDPLKKWGSLRGPFKYGPRLGKLDKKAGTRSLDTNPDFPAEFWVGDLKPLWEPKLREGKDQLEHYITGFEKFVEKAHKDGMTKKSSVKGGYLGAAAKGSFPPFERPLNIPDALDYRMFDTEHNKDPLGKGAIILPASGKRVWIYPLPDPKGIYVYFEVKHPYAPKKYPTEKDELLQKLHLVLKELRDKQPTIPGKIVVSPKRRPDAVSKETRKKNRQDLNGNARTGVIQRKPKTQGWRKKDWEEKRQKWDIGAKAFLKGAGEGPAERQKIDKALKIPTSGKHKQENEDLKNIQLWSGTTGKLMGELRWRFGELFDKLSEFFDKVKQKFEHWHKKSTSITPKGKLGGMWSKAMKIILKIASKVFRETLTLAYSSFAACANGLIEKLISKFINDATEELHTELEGAHKKVEELQSALEKNFEEYRKPLEMFAEATEDLPQWENILTALEVAIRLGVQIISCGSPPGLGCLWGLVVQAGIGIAVDLLTDTDYFNDNIAQPTAQKIMNELVGDTFRGLVTDTVSAVGLKDYAAGVNACMPRKYISAGGGLGGGTFDPNAPSVVKARTAWEKKNHDQIMKDLKDTFEKGGDDKDSKTPASVTEDDIKKMLEEMKKSKLTPDEMKKSFKAAKDEKTGKINFDGAMSGLAQEGGSTDEKAKTDDKTTDGDGTKVIDNTIPFEQLPSDLKVTTQFSSAVHAKSGHTQGTKVNLTIDIFRDGEYFVTLVNVPANVAGRVWYPSEADKKYLRIIYNLEKAVHLAPYAEGVYLRGNSSRQMKGNLKYGI